MGLRKGEQRLGMAGGADGGGVATGGEATARGGRGGRTTMMISGREVVVDMPPQAMSGGSAAAGPATGSAGDVAVSEGRAVFSVGSVKSKAGADVERDKEWNAAKDADGKGFAQKGEGG